MNQQQRVSELFHGYIHNTANDDEIEEFLAYVDDPAYTELIGQLITEIYENQEEPEGLSSRGRTRVLNHIFNETETVTPLPKVNRLWRLIGVAASIIIVLSVGSYFILNKPTTAPQVAKHTGNDVSPGSNRATLTLTNGKKIILTSNLSGQLAQQGNTLVKVNAGKTITYTSIGKYSGQEASYNTLTTAKGEQSPYPLVLADGTHVLLNAASSITFPTTFTGHERPVKITGEVYFEVVHNDLQPFKVIAGTQTIEDIGTAFNVNAYSDEPAVVTTLAEGKVKVLQSGKSVVLKPGQEAVSLHDGNILVREADLDAALSWKDGLFIFDNESLESIMRKVSRWYNVDIDYQGVDKHKLFGGGISRYRNVSEVLQKLELTGGIHFSIEGRRIIIRN